MNHFETTLLRWILILSGAFLMIAFGAVFLPVETMREVHRWLGLGEFPAAPITDYLARSTSLLYGVHGCVMLYTGWTIQYHWRFAKLLGWLHVVIGLTIIGIDLHAPMPTYWILIEGGPIAALGGLILFLVARGTSPESPSAAN